MKRAAISVAFVLLLSSFGSTNTLASAARYDVSYLWHGGLDSVYAYRRQVARVLGPQVSKRLRIAKKPGLYGLIYHRRGDSQGAIKVARAHTRLLRSRGLEPAAPIRSRQWNFIQDGGWRQPGAPEPKTSATPKRTQSVAPIAKQELKDLEAAVERYIKRMRSTGKISRDERTAWSVFDFTTGQKLVGINEDAQFQAASLIKPFFAMAYLHKVARGELKYGSNSRRQMERMIQHSNNRSTNWVLRQVGGPREAQRILSRHYPGIFKNTRIVEYIPANGRTYRNKASVHDYSRFLHALWKGTIPGAREIKRLMALPGPDRIYTGATAIPKGTQVYNKTGSTAQLCGDMGILVVKGRDGKRYAYTLVGVIEKRTRARNYGSWIRSRGNVIRKVSNLVYQGVSQHHKMRTL